MAPKGAWGITSIDSFGGSLDGTADGHYCSLGGIVKRNSVRSPNLVANEFICGRLAMTLGLPGPAGGIAKLDDGGVAYVALRFSPAGETPAPADIDALVQDHPKLCLRSVVFDCWIANADRHEKNVTYSRENRIPPLFFDHDKALLAADGIGRLQELRGHAILNGCIADCKPSVSDIGTIIGEVKWIADHLAADVCDEALRYGAVDIDQRDAVVKFLKTRADELHGLMNQWEAVKKLGLEIQ